MRRFLAAAVALAPLCIVSAAHADDTITSSQKGPVVTSTSGNVTINSGGSVTPGTLSSAPASCINNQSVTTIGCQQVAVYLNSGSTVTNNAAIGSNSLTKSSGGNIGILVLGGNAGAITNTGSIVLTDGYTPTSSGKNGVVYGAWSDTTNPQYNYGIRLIAPSSGSTAFSGSINSTSSSSITVVGNNSYGISIETGLVANGSLSEQTLTGSGNGPVRVLALATSNPITVSGDNSVGVNVAAAVTGDVWLKGAITATGQGSVGVQTSQAITGRLTIGAAVSATAYHYTSRPTDSTIKMFSNGPYTTGGVNSETLQGGPAVSIGANVTGGLLLDSNPTQSSTLSAPSTDLDLNGISDGDQSAGSITAFGRAPALRIGSTTQSVTLGVVGTTQTTSVAQQLYDYGLVLHGSIAANGVYDGFSSTGVQLGLPGSGQTVTLAGGGMFTSGGITATAYQATATAVLVNAGVNLPGGGVYNTGPGGITNAGGNIVATALSSGVNPNAYPTATGQPAEINQKAVAIDIENGANVPVINNIVGVNGTAGAISSIVAGGYGNATAILYKSTGALTINNQGVISAAIDNTPGSTPEDESPQSHYVNGYCDNSTSSATNQMAGCVVAIDARTSSGLTINQTAVSGANTPVIAGDIYLPTAATAVSNVNVQNGLVTGTINFGGGTVNVFVGGNATLSGPLLQNAGSVLNIDVAGTLNDGAGSPAQNGTPNALNVNSLKVEQGATIYAAINPSGTSGYVAKTAEIGGGAKLGLTFVNLVPQGGTQVYNFLQGVNSLTIDGPLDTSLLVHPYMYSSLTVGTAAGGNGLSTIAGCAAQSICVQVSESTPVGLNKAQGGFYGSFYAGLTGSAGNQDADLRDLFLAKTTKADFVRDYNQLMPMPAGATLLSLASGMREVDRALADSRPVSEPGETTGWSQEINYYADHTSNNGLGFRTNGVGVASGVEKGTSLGAFGVSVAFTSGDMKTPDQIGASDLGATAYEAGLYWRFARGGFKAWARGAAGYASFTSTRDFIDNPVIALTQTTTTSNTTTNPSTGQKTTSTTVNVTETPALSRIATATWSGYTMSGAAGLSWEKHFRRFYVKPEVSVEYLYLNENGYTENNGSGGINGIPLIVSSRAGRMMSTSAMINFGARLGDVAGQGGVTLELQGGYRDNIQADPGYTNVAFVANPSIKSKLAADRLTGGGPVVGFRLMAGGPNGYVALEGDAEEMDAYTEFVLMLRAAYRF